MPGIITAGIVVFALTMWTAFRHHDVKEGHRSFLQWVILMLFRIARFGYAVATGFDCGYLRYRMALDEAKLELENEAALGKVLKPVRQKSSSRPVVAGTWPMPDEPVRAEVVSPW